MENMTQKFRNALISMRYYLHKHPETAHNEEATAKYIVEFLNQFKPDKIITGLGGNGVAAIYNGKTDGPTILIRCELDGLPLKEGNELEYKSVFEDRAHLCGHDGHMVMVAGLAPLFYSSRLRKGRVVLLFQPAEETGEGASLVINDEKFKEIRPDYVFALHNLPGYEKSTIIVKKGTFASASKGIKIKLEGATSHAGHPEDGNNPSIAVAQILQSVMSLPQRAITFHDAALITPIHMRVGQPAFGTSPGEGTVMFTLRAHSNEIMETLQKKVIHEVSNIARVYQLSFSYEWTEPFEAVNNDDECVDIIKKSADSLKLEINEKEIPFPWSEDFGIFTSNFKGALFGLGSGTNAPQLHHPNYNFPDKIIDAGISMFYQIVMELTENTQS